MNDHYDDCYHSFLMSSSYYDAYFYDDDVTISLLVCRFMKFVSIAKFYPMVFISCLFLLYLFIIKKYVTSCADLL